MPDLSQMAAPLLAWYRENRRVLPFREDPTPYRVWVSEIMLQQTRVAAALPYYERFVQALPDVAALAACDEGRLHKLWEGLGYYSRVRNMQQTAHIVMARYGGELPADYEQLRALPGIGDYTAGAIASIAYGLPEVAVDGNVLRVFSRLLACEDDISRPGTKRALTAGVRAALPPDAPGDYNQALMELGALVCLPSGPVCGGCPLAALCAAREKGIAETLPRRAAKKPKKQVDFCVFVVHYGPRVLLHQRPPTGLLAGLWEPLLLEGRVDRADAVRHLSSLVPGAHIVGALPAARHVFTHRVWNMYGWRCTAPETAPLPPGNFVLATPAELRADYVLPGAFRAFLPAMLAPPEGQNR